MPRGRALAAALLGATFLGVATLALGSLTYFDFWWSLAAGQRILAERAVAATDPFTYTAGGQPRVNQMWAAQAFFALVWEHWGRPGLLAVKTLVVCATFGVVLRTMRARGVSLPAAAAMTLLAAWTGAPFWNVRPQIFTFLFAAVLGWLLREGWERRRGTPLLVPVLMVPWVNLDPGFVIGGALIAAVGGADAAVRLADPARRADGWRVLGRTAALLGAAALASLLNPFGARALLEAGEILRRTPYMLSSAESFAPNFHHSVFWGFELMLLLLFPAFARGRGALRASDVAPVLGLAHLGLVAVRFTPVFAILAGPPLAAALQAALAGWRAEERARALAAMRRRLPSLGPYLAAPGAPRAAGALLLLVVVVTYWVAVAQGPFNPLRVDLDEARYPVRTVAFIKEHRLPGPLFSVHAWGGYEIWRLHPEYRVFVAGQAHLTPPAVLDDFQEVANAGPRWRSVLDRWKVQTVLALRHSLLTETLRSAGGWRLVFTEREVAVFVRESDANRSLLARLERLSREPEAAPGEGEADPRVAAVEVAR